MSYKRLNIKNGDIINDYHINYLQDAISKISSESKDFKERLALILTNKGIQASRDDSFKDLISKVDSLPNYVVQQKEPAWPDIRENIKSGHIKLLVKTGGSVSFFIQATTAARFIIDWGDGTVQRYYFNQNGGWVEKNIANTSGTLINETYRVATIDISLDTENSAICRFQAPGGATQRNNILWFCSKDIIFTTGQRMFNNNSNTACENLKYIDVLGGSINGNLEYFARWCGSLERINANFNPGPNTVIYAFDGCTKLKEPPIINLNNVTSANALFYNCKAITEFNYYINNNGSFTDVASMFQGCINLRNFVPEQKFDFSKVTNQSSCFSECSNLITSPTIIFGSGTANYFYNSCTSLQNIQHEFDLTKITEVQYFFNKCLSLIDGPSEFYATNVTNASYLFNECTSLKAVPQVLNLPKALTTPYLFQKCYSLNIAPRTINLPVSTDIRCMFYECNTLTDAPNLIHAEKAIHANHLFYNCSMLTKSPVTIEIPIAQNLSAMFYQCSSLINGPDFINAPLANNASQFFQSCNLLVNAGRKFKIGNDNPASCTFEAFFRYCPSLETLPTEGDMHKGWNYQYCFQGTRITYDAFLNFCEKKGLNLPNATTLYWAFYDSNIKKLPNIDIPKCTNIQDTFRGSRILEEIGEINMPLCTIPTNAFYDLFTLMKLGKLTIDSVSNFNNLNFNYRHLLEKLVLKNLRSSVTFNSGSKLSSVRLEEPNVDLIGNLEFQSCNLNTDALNQLLDDLPNRSGKSQLTINIKGNPGSTSCSQEKGTSKNWKVIVS